MLDSFLNYFKKEKIDIRDHKVLCAVSGGKDSMVMLDLFIKAGTHVGVAHVNHNTRGEENLTEYKMLKEFCEVHQLPFHYKELDKDIANGPNFQAVARHLRYQWMDEVCKTFQYSYVATAHHMDDNVESFVMNLLRGSGLKGLSGISACKDGTIIRPMFYISRKEIDEFQIENDINFLEDSSNLKETYLRNKIRHHILSSLKKIDQNAVSQVNESIKLIAESESLLEHFILKDKSIDFYKEGNNFVLDLEKLNDYPSPATILWYKLNSFGFNKYDIQDILQSARSGAEFYTKSHKLVLSRKKLYLQEKQNEDSFFHHEVFEEGVYHVGNNYIELKLVETLELTKDEHVEYTGFQENPFPLIVRSKRQGDYFQPLGLKGKSKTIKDFITDQKIGYGQKENLLLIEKKGKIVCVVGYRISELFKVDKDTKYILKITKKSI